MNLTLGFSPCPNDTFLFDALVHKRINGQGLTFEPVLHDVEALNQMAFDQILDVTKLSYHAFAHLTEHYQMLRSGSALGEGVGPLLITKSTVPQQPESAWRVAVPGAYTTANLLLTLAFPEISKKDFMVFSEVEDAVLRGDVDAGVIIHENRFTYQDKGLHAIADLGDLWEKKQHLPIPLGGIAVRRSLPEEIKRKIQLLVNQSTDYAFRHPEHSLPFVRENAQEMDPQIMQKHIALYVNPYTLDLGDRGIAAVDRMLELLQTAGAIPGIHQPCFVG